MGLTEAERHEFVAGLKKRGWTPEQDTIWAPRRGLWFGASHFRDWTLDQFHAIFSQRAERIRNARVGDWESAARENQDAAEVAQEVLKESTQQRPA